MVQSPTETQRPLRLTFHVSRSSPVLVALAALVGYLLIYYLFLNSFKDVRGFILAGKQFVTKSDTSSVIKLDPTFPYSEAGGYDGQFAYFIALDPANARYYVDNPPYRYMRILYPMAARALALGNVEWVPYTLVLTNLLAVTAGTWAVAAWCTRRGLSPWLALVYAFYVGQVLAFVRDLTEILAYALVALAIYLFDRSPRGFLWSALLFGLAGLARETTLVFPALYGLFLFFGSMRDQEGPRPAWALLFAAVSMGPAVAWQLYLASWLGSMGIGKGPGFASLPLASLYDLYPLTPDVLSELAPVIVPGLICLGIGIFYLLKSREVRRRAEVCCMCVNALLFVALIPKPSAVETYASARIAIPVVLGAIYTLAFVPSRGWFYFCSGLWVVTSVAYLANPLLQWLHGS